MKFKSQKQVAATNTNTTNNGERSLGNGLRINYSSYSRVTI